MDALAASVKLAYSREMIDSMTSLVKEYNLMQPVTFPVNAALLKYSICEMQRLLFQVMPHVVPRVLVCHTTI